MSETLENTENKVDFSKEFNEIKSCLIQLRKKSISKSLIKLEIESLIEKLFKNDSQYDGLLEEIDDIRYFGTILKDTNKLKKNEVSKRKRRAGFAHFLNTNKLKKIEEPKVEEVKEENKLSKNDSKKESLSDKYSSFLDFDDYDM